MQTCPAGMKGNSNTNVCDNCPTNCVECSGDPLSCVKCYSPYYLDNGVCTL